MTASPTDRLTLKAVEVISPEGTATRLGADVDLGLTKDFITLTGEYAIAGDTKGQLDQSATGGATVGATIKLDEGTSLKTSLGLTPDQHSTTMALSGSRKSDEKTETTREVAITDTGLGEKTTAFTFGTTKKISEDLQLASTQSFGTAQDQYTTSNAYKLIREKDGRKLEGSLSRAYSESKTEVSRSNIFGLTGDINDRWAISGSLERGEVQNYDGTEAIRNALTLGAGYVKKDAETGEQTLKSSLKLETRFDEGNENKQQYLVLQTIEGKLTPELSLFTKAEFSRTRNDTSNRTEARYREMVFGGAYRPIDFDRLNLLGRYTYQENRAPAGQSNSADISQSRAHIFATEGIYDINEKWQLAEKFAYRIAEEKVSGFDFAKTHTWLMIHRLNYKIDADWVVGGEFRLLTQQEAKDNKRGFLLEVTRRIGEYAQIGLGYNFTQFNDDLTKLDYTTQGPFVRLTGTMYDRTKDEIERSKQKWLDEKIARWAWDIVGQEFSKKESPILEELNGYYMMAERAYQKGRLEEAQKIYKDIITAGLMMFEEASEHIRAQISQEKKLQDMRDLANQYIKNGQYDKAKKILEKILEEIEKGVIK